MALTERKSAAPAPGRGKPRRRRPEKDGRKFSLRGSSLLSGVTGIARALHRAHSPLASSLLEAIEKGDWLATTNLRCNPDDYSDPELFARDYLAAGLLRKCEHLPIDVDRLGAAMLKWHEAEETCRWINRHGGIDPFQPNWPLEDEPPEPTLEAVIHTAREKIRSALGRLDLNEVSASFAFSAGASTRLKRKNGHPFYKYSGKPEVTRNAALMAICAIWSIPLWRRHMQETYGDDPVNWVTIVEGSKVTTVRKTALIDRVIAIEPCMNMFMQKGLGSVIRRRLKKVGIDLNSQTWNQTLARIGSALGSLATIDLQSASDSIALMLVRALLPPEWFELIERLRCEVCILPDGTKHRLEKVSSMGNGFTFELESLIFWALSAAVLDLLGTSDKRLGIYGDDIVIHNSAAPLLIKVLARCGFVTNTDKTFVSGPFRESCGKHYFYGVDVTPFYVKGQTDETHNLYWLANSLREWSNNRGDAGFQPCYNHLVDLCRQRSRNRLCLVPESLGKTAGLIVNLDEAVPRWSRRRQQFVSARLIPRRRKHDPTGIPAVLAWLSAEKHEASMVIDTGDVKYYREFFSTSQWCTTGNTVVFSHSRASFVSP